MNTPNNEQLQLFSTPEPHLESSFYDWEIDREGTEKLINESGSSLPKNEVNKLPINDNRNTRCSDAWTCFQELEDSLWQRSNLEEYKQPSLWRSTQTRRQFCDRSSQEFRFTQISETTTYQKESSTLLAVDFRVLAHQTQEAEQDLNIQLPLFGEKASDALSKLNPASVLSNNLYELVIRRGLRPLLGGLSLAGYAWEIETVTAAELGAGHQRLRLFINKVIRGAIRS